MCGVLAAARTSLFQLLVTRKFDVGEKSMADTVSLGLLATITSLLGFCGLTACCCCMAAAGQKRSVEAWLGQGAQSLASRCG